ncbi:MAG: hypothetical protein WCJ64_23485 [Rhodospirillaceae bacterium]
MTEFRSSRRVRPLPGLMAIPVLALGLALAGCAGQSEADTEAMIKTRIDAEAQEQTRTKLNEYQAILAALRQTTMCVTTTEKRPEFKSLLAHGSNDGDSPPAPAKLVESRKASAKEVKLIGEFVAAMTPCKPDFGLLTTAANRNIARVINDTWTDQQELYGHLKQRTINWGAFNRGTRANSDRLSGALKALRLTNEG